jgi:hypothetical protein
MIDVAEEEVMDWSIPIPCELIPRDTIPPICIEAAVRKICELCEEIEDTLPDDIPSLEVVSYVSPGETGFAYHHVFHHEWED